MSPAPVASSERLGSLDVLRRFALLGNPAMNIHMMAVPFGAYFHPYTLWEFARRQPRGLPGHDRVLRDDRRD